MNAIDSPGTGLQNQQLEPFLIEVMPGGGSCEDTITHPGQEFIYCLEGQIQYRVGEQTFNMSLGDSLLLDASQPHCFFNATDAPASLIMVFETGQRGNLAQLRHLDA